MRLGSVCSLIKKLIGCASQTPESSEPRYRQRYRADDRFGVRRIYDRETRDYVDSDAMTPELLSRWYGRREKKSLNPKTIKGKINAISVRPPSLARCVYD